MMASLTGLSSQFRQGRKARKRLSRLRSPARGSDGSHFLHLGYIVAQHVLDAGLQGRRRAWAARARALHVQIDDAVLVAMEKDVAAILSHRRTHPRLEQLLDLLHHLVLVFVRERAFAAAEDYRRAGGEMLHDRA